MSPAVVATPVDDHVPTPREPSLPPTRELR